MLRTFSSGDPGRLLLPGSPNATWVRDVIDLYAQFYLGETRNHVFEKMDLFMYVTGVYSHVFICKQERSTISCCSWGYLCHISMA